MAAVWGPCTSWTVAWGMAAKEEPQFSPAVSVRRGRQLGAKSCPEFSSYYKTKYAEICLTPLPGGLS